MIAALSARNSQRSARASEAALRETRRQRRADDIRRELAGVGTIYDEASALIKALATDRRSDPGAVERCRHSLRRSMMTAELTSVWIDDLIQARQPFNQTQVDALYQEITRSSNALRDELHVLTGASSHIRLGSGHRGETEDEG